MFRPTIKHLIEIYYRAWKKAPGEFKEKIESVCIQDYMKNAILLHRSSPVISKVRMVGFKSSAVVTCASCCLFHPKKKFPLQILYYFHSKKGCDPVEKMLNDLYKPILWKSLSVRRRMDSRTCCTRVGVSCPLNSPFFFFFRRQVPNFEVRANAAHLLTEAFPLHDPAHSPQAVEAAIQKQLDMAMVKKQKSKEKLL